MFELRGYADERGIKRFASWFDGLDFAAAAKVSMALARMEHGNFSNVKGVGSGVFEYRIDFGPGYRIRSGMLGSIETRGSVMPLTHDFKDTIRARAQRDREFRQALLCEAVESILNGELTIGKAVLRDYVNATLGFQDLETQTQIPAKSLMRMLSPKGSPSVANLSSILTALQKTEGLRFQLSLKQ